VQVLVATEEHANLQTGSLSPEQRDDKIRTTFMGSLVQSFVFVDGVKVICYVVASPFGREQIGQCIGLGGSHPRSEHELMTGESYPKLLLAGRSSRHESKACCSSKMRRPRSISKQFAESSKDSAAGMASQRI